MVKKFSVLWGPKFPIFRIFFDFSDIFFLKIHVKSQKKYFPKSKFTKIAINQLYSTIKLFLWHLKFFSSFHHHVFKRSYSQKTAKNAFFGQLSFFLKKSYLENGGSYGKSRNTFYRQNIPDSCFSEPVFISLKKA